ncbi:hypothetical protein CQW23_26726 [Capsicum baccatum]|uniref:Uncharacterized protein n=1 Tax=Capsicum baccatum TaxID=33114 RepID=A0A2G2VPN2_CAPBA|nr:hypothetical protein CQW23_26726 [Capsicum baccatum]
MEIFFRWDKRVHERDGVAEKGSKGGHFNKAPTTAGSVELENEAAPSQPTANQVFASFGKASSSGEATATAEATIIDAYDHSTENSSNSEHQDLFVEDDVEFKSDVHEDNINLRAKRRTYQRRKRTERIPNDLEKFPFGEVGPDLGFDETKIVDKSLKGKVVADQRCIIVMMNTVWNRIQKMG